MPRRGEKKELEARLRAAKQREAALRAQIEALQKDLAEAANEVVSLKIAGVYLFGNEWGGKHDIIMEPRRQPITLDETWTMTAPGLLMGSQSSMAMGVLVEAGKPLHVREIAERLARAGRPVGLPSLTMTLARMARAGKHVVRVAPSTFGLKHWGDRPPAATAPAGDRSTRRGQGTTKVAKPRTARLAAAGGSTKGKPAAPGTKARAKGR